MPAPVMPRDEWKSATTTEEKSAGKRGTHWYRHPEYDTATNQEAYAYRLYTNGSLRSAEKAYNALVYAWPDSPQAPSAQLAVAQIMQKREYYEEAFDEYQYLIEHYPGRFRYPEVLEAQFQIANYLMNSRRGEFLFFPGFAAPDRALRLFEKIVKNAPSWEKAPLAQLNVGQIHEMNDELEEAIAAYEILLNRYPLSEWAATASYRQADCLCKLADQRPHDENAVNAARAALVDFIKSYPSHAAVPEAIQRRDALNRRVREMALARARFYDQLTKRPDAALSAYEQVCRTYPETEVAAQAAGRIEELRLIVTNTSRKAESP